MSSGKPTDRDTKMIAKVIEEGHRAVDIGKAGVGALLLFRDEILALGHNLSVENGDLSAHAEMVVLRDAAYRLGQMSDAEKAEVTIYSTLEPCIMCTCAISVTGIKRAVWSALTEDFNEDQMIAEGETIHTLNPKLTRGAMELVPGVLRDDGVKLLRRMGAEG